jgi:hypothetical protein
MPEPPNLTLALQLAARGWYILPLAPASKRPLGNCPDCAPGTSHTTARACPPDAGATASAPPLPTRQ